MKVYIDPGYNDAQKTGLHVAMRDFPCDMFIPVDSPLLADVLIEPDRGQHFCHGLSKRKLDTKAASGMYMRCGAGPAHIVTQSTKNLDKTPYWYVLFLHELGHAAGLRHDDDTDADKDSPKSVMEPNVLKHSLKMRDGVLSPHLVRDDLITLTLDYCR